MITASMLLAMGLCTGNCRTLMNDGYGSNQSALMSTEEPLPQCVALRGNGSWVSTHFASLARIVSDYGEVDGLAGGSSSTITSMIYESILLNPAVKRCKSDESDGAECGDTDDAKQKTRERRIELLLKSVYGVMAFAKSRIDTVAHFAPYWPLEIGEIAAFLQTITADNVEDFVKRAKELEAKLGLAGILNPEFIAFLQNKNAPKDFRLKEGKAAFAAFSGFRVLSKKPFFRPGVMDFKVFAQFMGRFADFYAGQFFDASNADDFSAWIERCDKITTKLSWLSMMEVKNAAISDCAKSFYPILNTYLKNYDANRLAETSKPAGSTRVVPRVFQAIGSELPVMISTSVLDQSQTANFKGMRDRFWAGEPGPGSTNKDGGVVDNFQVPFDSVHFGYWGPSLSYTSEVQGHLKKLYPNDLKSQKYMALGAADWDTVLQISPAEPGLAPMKPIFRKTETGQTDTGFYSIGGWSDLHPVGVMRAMNCKKVIYVTREKGKDDQAGEASIVFDASSQLNASKSEQADLYYTDESPYFEGAAEADKKTQPLSSFELALREATTPEGEAEPLGGVWCTKWNEYSGGKILAMAEEAYASRFFTKDREYLRTKARNILDPSSRYVNGCTLKKDVLEPGNSDKNLSLP